MPNVDKALSSGFLLFFKSQRADFDKDEEQVVSQSVNRGEGSAKVCVRDVSIFGDKDRIRRHFLGRLKTGTLVDIGLDGKWATTTTTTTTTTILLVNREAKHDFVVCFELLYYRAGGGG